MTDEEVRIESGAGVLASGISRSSAIMMEAAYLATPSKTHEESGARFFRTRNVSQDEEVPGPDARVYITKLSNRTPEAVIRRIPVMSAEREDDREDHEYYTVIFYINIQLDEPSTTRFINATVSFISSPTSKILRFSPKEKEDMAIIRETAGDRIFLSPFLEFSPTVLRDTGGIPGEPECGFEIYAGPEEKIRVTYRRKYGYSFHVPKNELLEYEGMRINEHEVSFEIFPPMPPYDREIARKGKHAIVSLIVQVPRNTSPGIIILVAGRVKGEIWGVVQVKGQVDFSARTPGNLTARKGGSGQHPKFLYP
jgi:hypothetical protein